MTDTGKKWLIGCSIAAGLAVMLVVGVVAVGVMLIRDTTKGFDDAATARRQLDERYGEPGAFTPAADGSIPAGRLEAFLAVREACAPHRARAAEAFATLPMSETEARAFEEKPFGERMRAGFGIARTAIGLGRNIGLLFGTRNRVLLEREMGMGEYTYIYALAYWVWLGHSPEDGPEIARAPAGRAAEPAGPPDGPADGATPAPPPARGPGGEPELRFGALVGGRLMGRVRADLRCMLRNQRDAAEAAGGGPDAAPSAAWLRALAAELERLEADPARLPWQDGLPDPILRSLEPFRDRLEAAYSPATNPFELARTRGEAGSTGVE